MSSPPSITPRPRLNPFLFPSGTDFRFALLIASVLGASLYIYNAIYISFGIRNPGFLDIYSKCAEAGSVDASIVLDFSGMNEALQTALEAGTQCIESQKQIEVVWLASGVVLLLLTATVIYWFLPAWKIWRDKFTPLNPDDAPDIAAYLADLCREAGLARPPIFLWNPLNPVSSGLAFGRLGRYYVALTGGLITHFYTDRPVFRAVVLHELAHLRNADVDKTYFAVATWRAFILATVAPFVITQSLALVNRLDLIWRILALTALVYLTRNAVLRIREFYADLRASQWEGQTGVLERVLESLPRPKESWRAMLQVHPDPLERRRILREPYRLFPMGFWEVFATGVAVTVGFGSINTFLTSLISGTLLRGFINLLTSYLAAALIFAPLIIGVVGAGIWRMTFAALREGRLPRGTGRLGLGLGLGLIVGQFIAFESSIGNSFFSENAGLTVYLVYFGVSVIWDLILLVSLFLFFRWMTVGAWLWLEAVHSKRAVQAAYGMGLAVTGGLLTLWLGLLLLVYDLVPPLSSLFLGLDLPAFLVVSGVLAFLLLAIDALTLQPLTLFLAILWAFPLSAWLWRKPTAATPEVNWAFLDPPIQLPPLPQGSPLRPGLALIVGVLGGLGCSVLLLLSRIVIRLSVDEIVRNSPEFRLMTYYILIGLAVLGQIGLAILVAAFVKRVGALHGLLAAFVAGSIAAISVLVFNVLFFAGGLDFEFALYTFSRIINWGVFLSLPLALGVSAAAGWVRQLWPKK